MKVGFLIQDKQNPDAWMEFARQHGIEGIEVIFHRPPVNIPSMKEIIGLFKKYPDVKPCAFGLWDVNILCAEDNQIKFNRQMTLQFLEYSAEAGCPVAYIGAGDRENTCLDEKVNILADEYSFYKEYAKRNNIQLGCYLGHKGNFINTRSILSKVLKEVPEFNVKLDPVGIIRNMKDDPYEIIKLCGSRIIHFHVKDICRTETWEIEPPVGMGDIRWNNVMALLHEAEYSGYIVIEPHGNVWAKPEKMWKYILLSKRHIEQFLV